MCSLQFTECCSYMYIYKAPYKAQLDFLQLHLEPHPFSLLQLHFIGCDTTSSFFRKGKENSLGSMEELP